MLYAITVTNNGPGDAFDVFVEDVLPPTVTFVNASRNCTGTTTVVCRVGTLGAGESETILIEATADEVGTTSNTATVSSSTPDPNFANNSSTALTTVRVGCFGAIATIVGSGLILGTPRPDVIVGSAGVDFILSLGGHDIVCARGGEDIVFGGPGFDSLFGQGGSDVVRGEADQDSVVGGEGKDQLLGEAGGDFIHGGPGSDGLNGGAGDDFIDGDGPGSADVSAHTDLCSGGPGTDTAERCELVMGVP